MSKVLVVGELNADLILNQLESGPEMGKEVIAREMTLTMGSSSAIFACNLSSLGQQVMCCGKLGKDLLAKLVLDTLEERGVDTRFVMQDEKLETGISVAIVQGNDRIMVTNPGAMELLSQEDVTDGMLSGAGHLHVSSVFLQPALKRGIVDLMSRAKKAGLTTSIDPQFDPAERWDLDLPTLLPLVDVFLPNRSELFGFTGITDPEEALESLSPFANTVVMKDGENGAFMWHQGSMEFQASYLNRHVVDIIGAGDSFDAGFLSGFVRGKNVHWCLDHAMLMGAVNTTGPGGTGAFEKGMDHIRQLVMERWQLTL